VENLRRLKKARQSAASPVSRRLSVNLAFKARGGREDDSDEESEGAPAAADPPEKTPQLQVRAAGRPV